MRLSEKECIERFQDRAGEYDPLELIRVLREVPLTESVRADAIIEFAITRGSSFKALVEIMPLATPKKTREKCQALSDALSKTDDKTLVPLVIAPYIGGRQAQILKREGVSWIDLSGNMMVRVGKNVYIERSGKPNEFPDTAPIKKIFQGVSSLVTRALLLKPAGFSSQYKLVDFINSRNANITAGTVSRVVKSLDEELLIDKTKRRVSVTNAEKLLERLAEGYTSYRKLKETRSYRFSPRGLEGSSARLNVDQSNYLACGFYAAQMKGLATTDERTFFVKDMGQAKREFDSYIIPDAEFGNLKFVETKDSALWFNSTEAELTIASGLQVSMPVVDDIGLYLEMLGATPRGPEIAEQLKWRILQGADIDG